VKINQSGSDLAATMVWAKGYQNNTPALSVARVAKYDMETATGKTLNLQFEASAGNAEGKEMSMPPPVLPN
jgi:hypothetical protein